MTAPRTPLFQRKGAAGSPAGGQPASSNRPQGPGDDKDPAVDAPAPETGENGEGQMATCPNCGCQFDPDNPDQYTPPGTDQMGQLGASPMGADAGASGGGGDLGAQVAAMLGGSSGQ